MTQFRPCIDLHHGQVKQIVGGSLSDSGKDLRTNFVSEHASEWYARRYHADGLFGGHIIMLGPGNEAAAAQALEAWPGGLQIGGGINAECAPRWLDAGADKIIVTSWLFPGGKLDMGRVHRLAKKVGPERVVIDLSCRRTGDGWFVATDRWQTVTDTLIGAELLNQLSDFCSEFLIHAADVEGLCRGIDADLVKALGSWSPLPCTYAGGANDITDLGTVENLSAGNLDLTFGSALDLFGGNQVKYQDCVEWNRRKKKNPR
jgi:phosphoribosylformimino-5-aminoimidazole carboxamide ribotide isomerase